MTPRHRARTNRPSRTLGLTLLVAALTVQLVITAAAHAATSLTIVASAPALTYGAPLTLSGVDAPAGVVESLTVESQIAGGVWMPIGTVSTVAATGAWSLPVAAPVASASYRIRSADSLVISPPVAVTVAPVVTLHPAKGAKAFYGESVKVTVVPAAYTGPVRLSSLGGGVTNPVVTVAIRHGKGTAVVADAGAGTFTLAAVTVATPLLAASAPAAGSFAAVGRTLKQGDAGPDVVGLQQRLHSMGFEIPVSGSRYTFSASEVTLAFQKYYGLPRTYVWGAREWAKLRALKGGGPTAHYPSDTSTHIEVDKWRQILEIAKGSTVIGIIAVSTGATGNTPLGSFDIYQRGGSYLYRFQAFHGDFGIHGYDPVPAYPASHGCVREPDWAATFTWDHSGVGTKVYIYQ